MTAPRAWQHLSAPVSHGEIRGEGLGWAAGSEHLFSAWFTLSRYDKTIIREALQFVRCLVRTAFLPLLLLLGLTGWFTSV